MADHKMLTAGQRYVLRQDCVLLRVLRPGRIIVLLGVALVFFAQGAGHPALAESPNHLLASDAPTYLPWVIAALASILALGFAAAAMHFRHKAVGEEFHRGILESSGALVCVVNKDGIVVGFNKASERVSGFGRDQILGQKLTTALVIPEEQSAVEMVIDDLLSDASPIEFETYWKTCDGQHRLISWLWTVYDDPSSKARYCVATGVDITEQQRVFSDIAMSSDRMAAVLDTANEGIITIDSRGTMQSVNKAAQKMFQYSEDELRGKNVSTLMPEPYAANHDNFIKNYLHSGDPRIIGKGREVEGRRKDGKTFPIELGISEWTQNGQTYFSGMIRDISERLITEEALRRSQKMEAIGQLTGGIAHDFNNILGVVIGNLDLIEDRRSPDDRSANLIHAAQRAVMRGAELTRRLLAFSRQKPGIRETIEINAVINGMGDILDKTLSKNIELVLALSDDLWAIKTDAGELETAILNMALNARDAMPDGGHFTIATTNRVLGDGHTIPDMPPGDYISLAFTDDGLGMSEEVRSQIFEPFYSTKPQSQGTGLGLSIIYSFVNSSGGHITVRSELGRGTTFEILLPRSLEPVVAKSPITAALPRVSGGTETILVVDDEPDMLDTSAEILENLGYDVIAVADTSVALDVLYGNERIDLLISDVVMPGDMNGFELATIASAQRPSLKVIMSSGYIDDIEDADRYRSLYAELLVKPYRRNELAQAVRRVLGAEIDEH